MSSNKPLASVQYEVEDLDDAIEVCFRKGWTDGLLVVPPTEEKVRRFLEAAGCEPGEVLGFYTEGRRRVTVEKVAINAVMAGCLPEYFPVVLARGYVNRCVNDIRRRPSQPLIQWRFHPHTVHRGRRLRSTQGPSDA